MTLRILVACVLALAAPHAAAISFDRYHDQDEINSFMTATAAAHPGFARARMLGYSARGRAINVLVLSRKDPDGVPGIYINGTHHGNEKSSTEAVLALADFLVARRNDPVVDRLLSSYAIYLQPLVNPDGHAAGVRGDSFGHDPNRDYSTPERAADEAFKIPPVRLVRDLSEHVRFRAAAALHSGMEGVLWPWGHSPQRSPDTDLLFTLSKRSAEAMGMPRYLQSFADYPTHGEFIDYVYSTFGTLALTFEISAEPMPPAALLRGVTHRAVAGLMAFMLSVLDHDEGLLALERAPGTLPRVAAAVMPRPVLARSE